MPNHSAVTDSPDRESQDAEKVDKAIEAIVAGKLRSAKQWLVDVTNNAPPPGTYQTQVEGPEKSLDIKFWDQNAFVHYVTWQKPDRNINWIPSAYPRAFFYLGFIAVKEGEYQQALQYLDQGIALEPTKPMLSFEKAQALVRLGQHQAALDLYQKFSTVGPFVSGHEVAIGLRGQGFVLIELGRLDEATQLFTESLKLEPESEVARNELIYIEHLKSGGKSSLMQSVASTDKDLSTCALCKMTVTEGTVINVDGIPVSLCKACVRKLTKKWWQFWK